MKGLRSNITIKKIKFDFATSNEYGKPKNNNIVTIGAYSSSNNTWTGNAASVEFTNNETAAWHLRSATISYIDNREQSTILFPKE